MKSVGFFRELRHGDPEGPSLRAARGRGRYEVGEVVTYLQCASVIAVSGEMAYDLLDDDPTPIGGLSVHSDGEWVWPSDLAFYVAKYGVELPDELVIRIRENSGVPPHLSERRVSEVIDASLGAVSDGVQTEGTT